MLVISTVFNNDREDLGKKVKDWLVEAGIYRDKVPDDKANWHYVVEIGPAAVLDVAQQKGKEDMVIIASGITLSKQHYDALRSLPRSKRDELLWDMRFQLLFQPCDFAMLPSETDLQTFQFTRGLFQDGLTKQALMDSLAMVHRCKLFVNWKMIQIFGENPKTIDPSIYQ
ncbi:MAG: DUF2299 family protein [Methanomassiliicoccales archaeon]|jgi:hypothetical protein